MSKIFSILIFSLFSLNQIAAQGTMHKQNGHFTAQLDFFGNYLVQNSAGHIKGSSLDYGNGLTNTDQKWYTEKSVKAKGLVQSAILQVDWWALFGEPTEQYQFVWQSSGYYDITYTDSKNKPVSIRISKENLGKYPDLLKRFDNLAPTDMAFEIKWKMGNPNENDIKKIEEKYTLDANFYSGLGSNNLNTNRLYKTDVKNGSLLFEPTGATPFATPSIRPGKGEEFLGIEKGQFNDANIKRILYWWQFCQTHTIDGFKAVKQNWPIDEMKAIAEKYLAYENGEEEPTPKEQIAKAEEKNKKTTAYAKNDFWSDAVEEENFKLTVFNENGKTGFKNEKGKIIIPAEWSYFTENDKYIATINWSPKKTHLYSKNGKLIKEWDMFSQVVFPYIVFSSGEMYSTNYKIYHLDSFDLIHEVSNKFTTLSLSDTKTYMGGKYLDIYDAIIMDAESEKDYRTEYGLKGNQKTLIHRTKTR